MKKELTDAEVENVRQKYLAGGITQWDLAREYNVSQATISRMLHGEGAQHGRAFRELDEIDDQILDCIDKADGPSMVDVYRCYNLEARYTRSEQFIRYRLESLARMGAIRIVKVRGKPVVRRCYLYGPED